MALQQGHEKVVALLLENDSKGKVKLPVSLLWSLGRNGKINWNFYNGVTQILFLFLPSSGSSHCSKEGWCQVSFKRRLYDVWDLHLCVYNLLSKTKILEIPCPRSWADRSVCLTPLTTRHGVSLGSLRLLIGIFPFRHVFFPFWADASYAFSTFHAPRIPLPFNCDPKSARDIGSVCCLVFWKIVLLLRKRFVYFWLGFSFPLSLFTRTREDQEKFFSTLKVP